jgi:hypothetical protein
VKKIIISSLLILFTSNSFAIECFDTTEINVQSTGILSTNAPSRFIVTDGNFKGYKIITNLNINNQNRLSNDVNDFKTNDNSTQNVFLMAPNGNHTEFSAKLIDPLDNKLGLHIPFHSGESAVFYSYNRICLNWSTDPIKF